MSMQGDIMDEITSPCRKFWLNILKNLGIANLPNVPARQRDHFSEKEFVESSRCLFCSLCHIATAPSNLQVRPYSHTEVAVKE
jgi:hypothetical protein